MAKRLIARYLVFNVCLLLLCVKTLMHVCFTMTAVDLSQTLHGNLVTAPPSSGRWQIISLSAQRRSLLESVGTIQCLDDTDSGSQQGARHPVKSRSCWRGWTCMRSARHIQVYSQLCASPNTRGKQKHKLHCCSSCWTLGSCSCRLSPVDNWGKVGRYKVTEMIKKDVWTGRQRFQKIHLGRRPVWKIKGECRVTAVFC